MNMTRLSDDDWGQLLPGETVQLGGTRLYIEPLGIARLARALRGLFGVAEKLKQAGITLKNFDKNPDTILTALADEIPDILADFSGLHRADAERLPGFKLLELLNAIIRVNFDSWQGLKKNLDALAGNIAETVAEAMGGDLETPSNS